MFTTANPSFFFPVESRNFSSEDLEFMRHAFQRACEEHPIETESEEQRYMLAQAIVSRYHRALSEKDLITVSLTTLH